MMVGAAMKEEFDYKAGTFPGTAEWLEDLETAGPDAVFAALSRVLELEVTFSSGDPAG